MARQGKTDTTAFGWAWMPIGKTAAESASSLPAAVGICGSHPPALSNRPPRHSRGLFTSPTGSSVALKSISVDDLHSRRSSWSGRALPKAFARESWIADRSFSIPSRHSIVCSSSPAGASGLNGADALQGSSDTSSSQGTSAVHGGERNICIQTHDSVTVPIVSTAMYWFENTQAVIDYNEGTRTSFEYGRYGNPTVRAAEDKICELEQAEDCLVSASGMCSVTTAMIALLEPGSHLITTQDCYRRTRQFVATVLSRMGVTYTVINDESELEGVLKERGVGNTAMFFSESPTNPYLKVIDIANVSRLCHQYGAIVCIDSTFATPMNQLAIPLGADLVLHSGTKFLAGHNDVLAGALAGRKDLIARVRALHGVLGGVIDPHAAYLLIRGMKTLHLRIAHVHYPGLESHPHHAIAVRQMKSGFGGVVSFEVKGDLWDAAKVIDGVKIPYIAPSLGGVETLIEQPTVISYWDQAPEVRAQIGIKDNLIRFSCGVEDPEDIIADVKQALDAL
eukprot:tig00021350_g20655.t1